MSNGTVHISRDPPSPPRNADFALYIDFKRGEGNAARVFQAADAMIRALQRIDHALCASIDSHIEPVLVLEEIQTGSLKIWLRDAFDKVDDDALKSMDWKKAVGKYLVRAKYVYIEWANRTDPNASLLDLAKNLRSIAAETDVRHLPDYAPPSIRELAEATQDVDSAKAFLIPGDKMLYLPGPASGASEPPIEFNLETKWSPEELLAIATKETTRFDNMPMNLIVKRPDYLGDAMWDFRHGRKPVSAKIAHTEWLRQFQNREIDVRPGDALKCLVTIEHSYGYDNELVGETYTVTKVENVLQNEFRQSDLWKKT